MAEVNTKSIIGRCGKGVQAGSTTAQGPPSTNDCVYRRRISPKPRVLYIRGNKAFIDETGHYFSCRFERYHENPKVFQNQAHQVVSLDKSLVVEEGEGIAEFVGLGFSPTIVTR